MTDVAEDAYRATVLRFLQESPKTYRELLEARQGNITGAKALLTVLDMESSKRIRFDACAGLWSLPRGA